MFSIHGGQAGHFSDTEKGQLHEDHCDRLQRVFSRWNAVFRSFT